VRDRSLAFAEVIQRRRELAMGVAVRRIVGDRLLETSAGGIKVARTAEFHAEDNESNEGDEGIDIVGVEMDDPREIQLRVLK